MDPLYDDPDARPRRLAVLAGFGIIAATGFATIAAMALDDGGTQQDTALPDSVITTSSSTPPGDSVHFRTADEPATGTSRPEPSRDYPAENSGRDVPEGANSSAGKPADTGESGDHPAPGGSDNGGDGDSGDDGGGGSDDPSGNPHPTRTPPPEDSGEQPPTKEPPESSTSSEPPNSESDPPPSSDSSSEDSSSQAASSDHTSTRESADRGTTA